VSVRVGIGLAGFPLASAAEYWSWVDRCEDSPLDSLWQTDRLVSRTPHLEPMSVMAALAARTRRIKFGMNAVVIPFRDPLLLAKQCASIDFLSGGRLLPVFGVGADRAPEWRASGRIGPAARGRASNEALELMRRLWSEDRVDFEGEYFRFEDVSISPHPVQRPLPCWIGGSSPAALRRTAQHGSGWLGGREGPDQVRSAIVGIQRELANSGRRIAPDHYGATLPFRIGGIGDRLGELDERLRSLLEARLRAGAPAARSVDFDTAVRDQFAIGEPDLVIARLREFHVAGASKYVLLPLATDIDELLEQTRRLIDEVVPEVHSWRNPELPAD